MTLPPRALVIAYHGIGDAEPPLSIPSERLREHLDLLVRRGTRTLKVAELAAMLRAGSLPPDAVALTFDDGCASVATVVAPLLVERGLTGTVFCVAGRLGTHSDWKTSHADPGRPLMTLEQVAAVADAGVEIGSHGYTHGSLSGLTGEALQHEVVDSRRELERVAGAPVKSFSFPYGALPGRSGLTLVERTYAAACAGAGWVDADSDPCQLPRVDAHYLRRQGALQRALRAPVHPYLRGRALVSRMRRQ